MWSKEGENHLFLKQAKCAVLECAAFFYGMQCAFGGWGDGGCCTFVVHLVSCVVCILFLSTEGFQWRLYCAILTLPEAVIHSRGPCFKGD